MSKLRVIAVAAILSVVAMAGETYKVDGGHSAVLFSVKHLNVSYVYGQFTEFEGSFHYNPETREISEVAVTINANSVNTHHAKRDKHTKSADFLDVMQYPEITFKSKGATPNGEGQYEIKGDLSLHGVSKPATLVMEEVGAGNDPWGGFRRGFHGETTIKRADHDMTFLLEGVSDEIRIIVSIESVRQ